MAGKSYKMRMYQRRLWQNRAQIVITGVAIWIAIAALIILAVESAS